VAKSYQRECLHCKELFDPGIRHRWRQKFCAKPGCRAASKAASQRRWLSKPENHDHFRGSANVERVRRWREAHPEYWKRAKKSSSTLQDLVPAQAPAPQNIPPTRSPAPLQDLFAVQDPLLVGVIAHLIDSPLQDHVEQTTLRLLAWISTDNHCPKGGPRCVVDSVPADGRDSRAPRAFAFKLTGAREARVLSNMVRRSVVRHHHIVNQSVRPH